MKRGGGKNREVTMTRDKDWTYIEMRRVAIEHARDVQLLHFFFEAAREAGVHARPAREYDVLVQLLADVDRGTLDRLESISATPSCSMSTGCGWDRHSGASNCSELTLIVRPSGKLMNAISQS
jgi:hypothetical protein